MVKTEYDEIVPTLLYFIYLSNATNAVCASTEPIIME